MTILVFTKPNCGLCASAKDKLDRMQLTYEVRDYDAILEPHEGWRDDGTVEFRAMAALIREKVPMIVIDGVPYEYSAAMAELKRRKREATS